MGLKAKILSFVVPFKTVTEKERIEVKTRLFKSNGYTHETKSENWEKYGCLIDRLAKYNISLLEGNELGLSGLSSEIVIERNYRYGKCIEEKVGREKIGQTL